MNQAVRRTRWIAIVVASLALLLAPGAVAAHAELDTATPPDGATVEGAPPEVSGTFTQDMWPEASSLELRDKKGNVIGRGGVDPGNPRRMAIAGLQVLDPGTYEVRWTTTSSEDDELARGTWTFKVVLPATSEPTAEPTPEPTPEATPSPSVAPSGSAPTSTPVQASASAAASAGTTPSAVPAASDAATPAPSDGSGAPAASGSDVLLPIVIGIAIVAAAGVVLIRRRPSSGT